MVIKASEWVLEEYMDWIDNPEIQLELNTLSTRSRISHLEEIFINIQKQIDKAYIYQHEAVESLMKESLQTNYHRVIFDIKNAQAGVNYPPRSTTASYTGSLQGTRVARDMFNKEVKVDTSH